VDQGHASSQLAYEGNILAGECRFCAISLRSASSSPGSVDAFVVEEVDENVVVVSGPALDGLVVIPRSHVSVLEELPVVHRAQVLAALQRATRRVQERNPGMPMKVVVMTDPAASKGHAGFQVVPGEPSP
jgi:diadenosine tetraphosphate (Ap4A) HIT family hydrolase